LSMGAIVGISAHGRTKEKVANVADREYTSESMVDVRHRHEDERCGDEEEQKDCKE
jgi:hypothetical protein